jgi:hypothetical protein
LPVFQVKSRERKQSPGLDFLLTFLSMKKVRKKKDLENSVFLKRKCLANEFKECLSFKKNSERASRSPRLPDSYRDFA